MTDLVQFNGILLRDGVLGGSNGALYEKWNTNSPIYSPEISQSMVLTSVYEIKWNTKLCNNNEEKSRYQKGNELQPCIKNNLPYKALVENTNAISAKGNENKVNDDSSWPHYGYSEAGSGVCGRLS